MTAMHGLLFDLLCFVTTADIFEFVFVIMYTWALYFVHHEPIT